MVPNPQILEFGSWTIIGGLHDPSTCKYKNNQLSSATYMETEASENIALFILSIGNCMGVSNIEDKYHGFVYFQMLQNFLFVLASPKSRILPLSESYSARFLPAFFYSPTTQKCFPVFVLFCSVFIFVHLSQFFNSLLQNETPLFGKQLETFNNFFTVAKQLKNQ